MKYLLFCLLASSFTFFGFNGASTTVDEPTHHDCKCTSGIGGSASARCTDAQGCNCSSAFFSCGCDCVPDGNATNRSISAGPIGNWEAVQTVLANQENEAAQQLATDMTGVYELAETNSEAFREQAHALNTQFEDLPMSIVEAVMAAIE